MVYNKEYYKKYYQKNKEKIKQYYQDNKYKWKKYYLENKNKHQSNCKKWQKKNLMKAIFDRKFAKI